MRHLATRLILTGVLLALTSCGLESAGEPGAAIPQASSTTSRLMLVIHGGGDDPASWAEELIQEVAPELPDPETWSVHAIDWHADAEDRTTASRKGLRLGEAIGEELRARDVTYAHVVIVSHSVGSFVAHGITTTLSESEQAPFIHAIYLDPFTLRGVLRWGYGDRLFGEGADFAESYLNSDDGAPLTNDSLGQAHTIDVTHLRPADLPEERWHWWPIDAWLSLERHDAGVQMIERALLDPCLHEDFERGTTRVF